MKTNQMRIKLFGLFSFACLILFLLYLYISLPSNPNISSVNGSDLSKAIPNNIDNEIVINLADAYELGNNEKKYREAIQHMENIKNDHRFETAHDSSKAAIYHRIGAYHFMNNDFIDAEGFLDTAIHIRSKLEIQMPIELANSLFIRSNSKFYNRNIEAALDDILYAITIIENHEKNESILIKYYKYAGRIHLNLNDEKQAAYYFQMVDDTVNIEDIENTEFNAILVHELGNFYKAINNEKATKYLEKAVDIFSKIGQFQNEGEVLISLSSLNLMSNPEKGRLYANKALSAISKVTDKEVNLNNIKSKAYNNLGVAFKLEGKLEESKENYTKIFNLYKNQNIKHHVFLAWSLEGLGDVDLEKKDYNNAILNYHNAIKALCVGYEEKDVYSSPSVRDCKIYSWIDLQRILTFKLEAMNKLQQDREGNIDLQKAIFYHYKTLDEINFHIRHTYKTSASRFNFIKSSLASYEATINIALTLFETTKEDSYLLEAYHFASKNKALVMLDALQDEKAKFAEIPIELLEEEKQLKSVYLQLDAKLTAVEEKGESIKEIRKSRFETIRNYQKLMAKFEKDYPKYFQLKYAHSKIVNPIELVGHLPENTAIIEFFIGEKYLYTFVISKENELQYWKKPKPNDFKKLCFTYRKYIETKSPPIPSEYGKTAMPLFDLLLKEELTALKRENEDLNRLIIIPDHELLQFSFDPLFVSSPKESDQWSNPSLPYLAKKYAISYAYSNQLIFDAISKNDIVNTKYPYLGVGLDYRDENISNLKELLEKDTVRSKGILPHSVEEIEEISKLFKGEINLINQTALKENFLKNAGVSDILHLAMHGMSNLDDPKNSSLIFSSYKNDDYILTAGEIYNIKFNADLAVLSACHTGDGLVEKGEGIRSLARAFNFAGCSSVVASLWSADDQITKKIVVEFFKNIIEKGQPKDIALQQAKLHYLKGEDFTSFKAPPSFWAHLISIGDVGPIKD